MRRTARTHEEVEAEISALDQLDTKQLQQRWKELYGHEAPPRIRAPLLRRFVAYRIQVLAFGGLKPTTIRLLRKMADELRARRHALRSGEPTSATPLLNKLGSASTLSPGTQLLREWNGATETVEVTSDGFTWRSQNFGTLSAVAKAITGTKWSGPRFFGLQQQVSTRRSPTRAEEPAS